jgi:hypothetical protein
MDAYKKERAGEYEQTGDKGHVGTGIFITFLQLR